MRTIDIPGELPEIKGGKRVLLFLGPRHPREINIHGEVNDDHPELLPRDLPCPEPMPQARPQRGAKATPQQMREAYDALNSTNPIRTCLGAPPKQFPALLSVLGAKGATINDIWARVFAPHLMAALSASLSAQNNAHAHLKCEIPNCKRCEEGEAKEPKRKRRKLTAGAYALNG